jgi:uncharacterized Fe-S center protein
MNNMSVDCDCAGVSAAPPTLADIGILASTDALAIDQACIDLIYALPVEEKKHLVERIESRKGSCACSLTWKRLVWVQDNMNLYISVDPSG